MSYFAPRDVVYIIVPTADITTEMVNNMKMSFNSTTDTLRESNDGKTLFKIKVPVSAAFNGYTWYNLEDITAEMEKVGWNG